MMQFETERNIEFSIQNLTWDIKECYLISSRYLRENFESFTEIKIFNQNLVLTSIFPVEQSMSQSQHTNSEQSCSYEII